MFLRIPFHLQVFHHTVYDLTSSFHYTRFLTGVSPSNVDYDDTLLIFSMMIMILFKQGHYVIFCFAVS
jgi:hypothetical protein